MIHNVLILLSARLELHHMQLHSNTILTTVDFTSDGMPVGVAAGNVWLVRLATFILQPMEHTNHKFPAAMAMGVPCEVKSTVQSM